MRQNKQSCSSSSRACGLPAAVPSVQQQRMELRACGAPPKKHWSGAEGLLCCCAVATPHPIHPHTHRSSCWVAGRSLTMEAT